MSYANTRKNIVKKLYEKNRDKTNERQRIYRANNKDKFNEYQRAYRANIKLIKIY
jgi:hypothetical protein